MKEFSLHLDVVGAEVSDPGQQRPDQAAADERDPGWVCSTSCCPSSYT